MTAQDYTLSPAPGDYGLPFPSWRRWQTQPIEDLANSFSRFNILSAPTGSGKSLIAVGLAKLTGMRTLILTSTKGLQDQYLQDFAAAGLVDIRGQNNYRCVMGCDCAQGAKYGCSARRGPQEKSECGYVQRKVAAQRNQLVITNYSYRLTMNRYQEKPEDHLGIFDLLVMDEAHRVPNILSDFCSFKIMAKEVRGLLPGVGWPRDLAEDDQAGWIEWARGAVKTCEDQYQETKKKVEEGGKEGSTAKELDRLKELGRSLRTLSTLDTLTETTWITQKERGGGRSWTPLWGHHYAENWLYRGVNKVVATSATIGRSDGKYLGMTTECPPCEGEGVLDAELDSGEVLQCGDCAGVGTVENFAYHEVSKAFHPSRRPFVYCKLTPPIRVDFRTTAGQKKILYASMDRYIEQRLHQKGIIHPRSYARAKEVLEYSAWSDLMITHENSRGLPAAVERFKSASPPCILVSPSIEEGFDFPGDEARWQVVLKVPFVYGGDPLMKARSKEDPEYKNYLAAQSLVQMVGRAVRSADDWAQAVIFDSHWGWFNRKIGWQRWFSEAFGWASGVSSVEIMDKDSRG